MIKGLNEAHLPVSNLEKSIAFYEKLGLEVENIIPEKVAFLWIEKNKSWIGLWQSEQVNLDYHPSIRHIAFEVTLIDLKKSVDWLKERGIYTRAAFGFEGHEPFVLPHINNAYAKIHFPDPDGNSLEFQCQIPNPEQCLDKMYLSEWEDKFLN
ncbi:VOC family protein [Macrococcus animalis]|uniref:VOC family protein n=1 Tax=Macrococcus animalis TaxID=3395467 RepID=UPI0039BDBB31